MLVKEIKEILSTKEFAHCTDAILSIVLEKPRTDIKEDDFISEENSKYCKELAEDFTKSYPLIYQRGKTYFMDNPLEITKDVFPPVFATEPFINEIISKFSNKKKILEIGTGSGAMAIAIAKNNKDCEIIATDISNEILEVAKRNVDLNKLTNIKLIKSNLFNEIDEKFDLIFSNPPQQKTEKLNKADKEGSLITPKVASDGGRDGLDLYNKIKNQAKQYLTEDGVLVLQYDGYTNIYKYNEL